MSGTIKHAKVPQQRRSAATVEAILQAAIQVLHRQGKAKLTTTRIAERAGVSVGTLYQYFPHKTALLQEALRRHLDGLATAVERACTAAHGQPLPQIAEAIANAWIATKLSTVDASVALYSVTDDIEGRAITVELRQRVIAAIAQAFRSAPGAIVQQPESVGQTLLGALSGVSRDLLDPELKPAERALVGDQLSCMVCAYVLAAAAVCQRDTPSNGELAVAYSRRGIRPARNA